MNIYYVLCLILFMGTGYKIHSNPAKEAMAYYVNAPYGAQLLMGAGALFIISQGGVIYKNWSAYRQGHDTFHEYYSSDKEQSAVLSNKMSTLFISDALAWITIVSASFIINAYKKYSI